MSKSLDNYVGITEPAAGAVRQAHVDPRRRSCPTTSSTRPAGRPSASPRSTGQLASGELHPNDAKRLLARTVVDLYHGPGAGEAAEADFDRMFKAHAAPEDIPEVELPEPAARAGSRSCWWRSGLASSGREASRLIKEGAVKIDGEPAGEDRELAADEIDGRVFQVGKRHFVPGPAAGG